jgi:tripartite-type tricarboxylate transporter receptor subunit TctC
LLGGLRNALVVAAIAFACTAPRGAAQPYPSRPIRLIVPASVSTPPDIVCHDRYQGASLTRAQAA